MSLFGWHRADALLPRDAQLSLTPTLGELMDAKHYAASLAELRGIRDDIKALRKELAAAESDRDKLVARPGFCAKAPISA